MRRHQRGVTMIGWLILLTPMAIVFYAGVRLAPIYLNYQKVVHSLTQVAGEEANATSTAEGLRRAVGRHFEIESVDFPDIKDLKIVRENGTWTIETNYDDQGPLFAGIALLVTFDKKVKLKSAVGE